MNEFVPISEEVAKRKFKEVPIDEVKTYWNKRPCNIRHSPAEIGSKEYFDQVEERKYFVETHIRGFAEFPKWKGKKVLEVGCGLGTESVNFAREGADITCMDISKVSLDLVKKRFDVFGLKGKFYEGNAEDLDTIFDVENMKEEDKFDLIWSFGVIHHTPNPRNCIKQFERVLKKDGEVRVMVYSKISYKLFFVMRETGDWNFSRMEKLIAHYSEAQTGCPVAFTYTEDEIRDNLFKDWIVEKVFKDHIFTWDIDEYKKYNYVKEDCWKNVDDEFLDELAKELGWHTMVIARKNPRIESENSNQQNNHLNENGNHQ